MPIIRTQDILGYDATTPSYVRLTQDPELDHFYSEAGTIRVVNDYDSRQNSAVWITNETALPYRGAIFPISAIPTIPHECCLYNNEIIAELNSTNRNGIIQVFRSSSDDLSCIELLLSGESESEFTENIENFESYISDSDLRSNWVPDDTKNTNASLKTSNGAEGSSQWMKIKTKKNKSKLDRVIYTLDNPKDFSGVNSLQLFYQSEERGFKVNIILSDVNNEAYAQITNSDKDVWEQKTLPLEHFVNISMLNLEEILSISIEIVSNVSSDIGIDEILLVGNNLESNRVTLGLFDLGNSYINTNSFTLETPEKIISLELDILPKFNTFHFGLEHITKDNYYAIVVYPPLDGIIKVFGTNTKQYLSGGAHTLLNDQTSATPDINRSLYFIQKAERPAILKEIKFVADDDSYHSFISANYQISDTTTGEIFKISHLGKLKFNNNMIKIDFKPNPVEFLLLDKNHKLLLSCQDDEHAKYGIIFTELKFYYEFFETHG